MLRSTRVMLRAFVAAVGLTSALSLGSPNEALAQDYSVTGYIDGIQNINSRPYLAGWACSKNDTRSIEIHLYTQNDAGQLTWGINAGVTNQPSEPGVAAACQSSGTQYRFQIDLTQVPSSLIGQKLLIFGISRHGLPNNLLQQSGTFRVPASVDRTVIGYIQEIVQINGKPHLLGWACSKNDSTSIPIHFYLGGPAGVSGYGWDLGPTPVASGTDVSSACQSTGTRHRFQIDLSPYQAAHAGKAIYIHGINFYGGTHNLIERSGQLVVPPFDHSVTGSIEGIEDVGGRPYLKGWACAKNYSPSIEVHLYFGSAVGQWTGSINAGLTNVASEPAIAAACFSQGSAHRFRIDLGPYQISHAGHKLFVYGISPHGLGNPLIANSGTHAVPAVPLVPPQILSPANGTTIPGSTVTISWAAVPGAAKYLIRMRDETAGGVSVAYSDNHTSTQFSSAVTPGRTYLFWIHSSSADASTYSAASSVGFSVAVPVTTVPPTTTTTSPYAPPNCSQIYTGLHDRVGLSNGDPRFLCYDARWYECQWEGNDPTWETKVANGGIVGTRKCSTTTGWGAPGSATPTTTTAPVTTTTTTTVLVTTTTTTMPTAGTTGPVTVTPLGINDRTYAATPNPLTDNRKFGVSIESPTVPPFFAGPHMLKPLCQAGGGWARYWLNWYYVQHQGANNYDWEKYDRDIDALLKMGMNIYLNVLYAPPWAAQDSKATTPYACIGAGRTAESNWQIAGEPQCNYTASVDEIAYRNFVRAAVKRYGKKIKYWGFINEADNFYLPIAGWPQSNFDFVQVIGADEARAVQPDVKIVGPDAAVGLGDTADYNYWNSLPGWRERIKSTMHGALEADRRYRATRGKNLFDVIAFHSYVDFNPAVGDPWASFAKSLDVDKKPLVDSFLRESPRDGVWVTEVGLHNSAADHLDPFSADPDGNLTKQMLQAVASRPWVNKIFQHTVISRQNTRGIVGFAPPLPAEGRDSAADQLNASYFSVGPVFSGYRSVALGSAPEPAACSQNPGWPQLPTSLESVTAIDNNVPHGTQYFAEACVRHEDTFFHVVNPNALTAKVRLYISGDIGRFAKVVNVPANTLQKLQLRDLVPPGCYAVAIQSLTTGAPVFVEKFMGTGEGPTTLQAWGQGTNVGSRTLGKSISFAEGNLTASVFHANHFNVFNPNAATATVTVNYYNDAGQKVGADANVAIAPFSRHWSGPYYLFPHLSGAISTQIQSNLPVMAERSIFFKHPAEVIPAGKYPRNDRLSSEAGIQTPGTKLVLVEGSTHFDTYVLIFNPSTSTASANIITRNSGGAQISALNFTLGPKAKTQYHLQSQLLGSSDHVGDVTFEINSNVGLVAERSYWVGTFLEGSASAALSQSAKRWIVPGASEKSDFTTYVHVRAGGSASTVRLMAYTESGEVFTIGDFSIAANGRYTYATQLDSRLKGKDFAVKVEVLSGSNVYVEKSLFQRPGTPGTHFKGASVSPGVPY